MTLTDLIVVAITLAVCRFIPEFAFWGVAFTVALALILERVLKGERVPTSSAPKA